MANNFPPMLTHSGMLKTFQNFCDLLKSFTFLGVSSIKHACRALPKILIIESSNQNSEKKKSGNLSFMHRLRFGEGAGVTF